LNKNRRTERVDKKDGKKRPFDKLKAAAVLAAALAGTASCVDVKVTAIPYEVDGGITCLADDGNVQRVGECEMTEEQELRTGNVLIAGAVGFELTEVVDSNSTKAAKVTPINGWNDCQTEEPVEIFAGETRVVTVNDEQYSVSVSSIEYDADGAKVTMSAAHNCDED
jgi:hypothetical protein